MEHNWEKYFDTESDYWKRVQVIYEENEHYPKVVVSDRNLHHKFLRAFSKKEKTDVDNEPENLVSLSIPDHLRVHYYLFKCTKKGYRQITGFPVRLMLRKAMGSISDETLEMIANDYKNLTIRLSKETKKKISLANTGKKRSKEARKKVSDARKGRPLSEKNRENISKSMKGHKCSEETKRKIAESHKGKSRKTTWSYKKVMCIETGVVYESVAEAKRQTGANSISACCLGKRKTTGGYHWRYA